MKEPSINELRQMTDDELLEISLRKKANGCYSGLANKAQQVRRERAGYVWGDGCSHENVDIAYNGARMTKKFSDVNRVWVDDHWVKIREEGYK